MTYHVVFQGVVHPAQGEVAGKFYARLLPLLHRSPGFISETPFASATNPNGSLEFATFADAEAVNTWRVQKTHLAIERTGREKVFEGYRIRVGPALEDSEHETEEDRESGQLLVVYQRLIAEAAPEDISPENVKGLVHVADDVLWSKLDDEAKYQSEKTVLWLSAWKDRAAATNFEQGIRRVAGDSVLSVKVVRDYGKDDRKEAPGHENEAVAPASENIA